MKVYLVGGAVRDQLLNIPIQERDWVVVGASPQEMVDKGYRQVGKDFPVFLHPKTNEEYALARTERKTGPGYTGFVCHAAPDVTLEQDLLRRDLTINAMALTERGDLIDPHNGFEDLTKRILRHVSDAFVEDPLRVLRLARFAAQLAPFGFVIAEKTQQLILAMVREGQMQQLVPERVWLELEKALATNAPHRFMEVLRSCGALNELFPEIDALFGVPNPVIWHPEIDSGVHTLMALEQAARLSDDNAVRFAVLVHDLGKAHTSMDMWPSHTGHGEKGVASIKALCKRYPVPKHYAELAILVSRVHIDCHKSQELTAQAVFSILETADAFRRPERFALTLKACHADVRGRTGFEDSDYPQQEFLQEALAVASRVDIQTLVNQGMTGQALGEALRQMRLQAVEKFCQ